VSAPASTDVAVVAAAFGDALHRAGVPVTPERSGRFAAAIALAAPYATDELYWLGRTTLLSDRAQIEMYDRVFTHVFRGMEDPADWRGDANSPPPVHSRAGEPRSAPGHDGPSREQDRPAPAMPGGEGAGDAGDRDAETVLAASSAQELLRHKEFAALSPDEWAMLRHLAQTFQLAAPPRRSRRTRRHRRGDQLDLRATLRRAHRTGGDPLRQERQRRRTRPRRIVLLCDISGSMEATSRAYLHLAHSAVQGANAEVFVFATRLTRITRMLQASHPDLALYRAGQLAPDWSGGTRIGMAIKAFTDGWGRRGLARGSVIVIVSDGWERDDPVVLEREMQRLARLAHRIVWINPRAASARWQPLAGGMRAAMPSVDVLVSGHSIAALDAVVAAISGSGLRRAR
jgi:uncharacterized protein